MVERDVGKPGNPVARAAGGAALFTLVGALALAVFPSILLIVLFVAGPALVAFFFAGRPADRDTFFANGYAISIASGLLGAAWIGLFSDDDIEPVAVAVGAFVSLILLTLFGMLGCFVSGRWVGREKVSE